ncbi:hypothetical protein CLV47_10448 [Antricoccus suffuscus]|uniref:Molybdopterin-dependent oxidoreductase-like protein n=1 Tax=Antricoccus suffuscus TaxID=1629062 RepID=A0A2T1A2E4_9ACTN|nr:hypothetical protein CLV47_10448 [Antricoccus suffuscus]
MYGAWQPGVTFALGELDPNFGNNPAVLTTVAGHLALVVPADTTILRDVWDVRRIDVSVSAAQPVTAAPGSLVVDNGSRTATLSAQQLASLPQQSQQVAFSAGGAPETHTEAGPTLRDVLSAAGLWPLSTTSVTAVGSDGYAAAVTPAEATLGGRPLLISLREDGQPLAQPRLITKGDIKGGRYVSNTVVLDVATKPLF